MLALVCPECHSVDVQLSEVNKVSQAYKVQDVKIGGSGVFAGFVTIVVTEEPCNTEHLDAVEQDFVCNNCGAVLPFDDINDGKVDIQYG